MWSSVNKHFVPGIVTNSSINLLGGKECKFGGSVSSFVIGELGSMVDFVSDLGQRMVLCSKLFPRTRYDDFLN